MKYSSHWDSETNKIDKKSSNRSCNLKSALKSLSYLKTLSRLSKSGRLKHCMLVNLS